MGGLRFRSWLASWYWPLARLATSCCRRSAIWLAPVDDRLVVAVEVASGAVELADAAAVDALDVSVDGVEEPLVAPELVTGPAAMSVSKSDESCWRKSAIALEATENKLVLEVEVDDPEASDAPPAAGRGGGPAGGPDVGPCAPPMLMNPHDWLPLWLETSDDRVSPENCVAAVPLGKDSAEAAETAEPAWMLLVAEDALDELV